MRPGMYRGTRSLTNCGPKRCSVPNTASGIAKHKFAKATTLSRPRAAAISFLAAHTPINESAMPATHIAVAVRDNSKNSARKVACIDSPMGAEFRILLRHGAFGSGLAAQLREHVSKIGFDVPTILKSAVKSRVQRTENQAR